MASFAAARNIEDVQDEAPYVCPCCGASEISDEICDCWLGLVDDSDPSVGYHAEIWWCDTHKRKAE